MADAEGHKDIEAFNELQQKLMIQTQTLKNVSESTRSRLVGFSLRFRRDRIAWQCIFMAIHMRFCFTIYPPMQASARLCSSMTSC